MREPISFLQLEGTIGRRAYAAIGALLMGLKFLLDNSLSRAVFDRPCSLFNYLHLYRYEPVAVPPRYYLTFLLASIPFVWIGVVLTFRRLRDAGLPRWLTFLFFIPVINL